MNTKLTQGDLFPWARRQQEDEQGKARDEDTGDEQVQTVIQSPSPHDHRERHVRVRLLTAVIEPLTAPPRDLWKHTQTSKSYATPWTSMWKEDSIDVDNNWNNVLMECRAPLWGPCQKKNSMGIFCDRLRYWCADLFCNQHYGNWLQWNLTGMNLCFLKIHPTD